MSITGIDKDLKMQNQYANVVSKPKQPLSAYNLFFLLERDRILNGTSCLDLPITSQQLQQVCDNHKKKGKRVHRKTHGKIGFCDLARVVAEKWKRLDSSGKKILKYQANIEKKHYASQSKAWREYQKTLQFNSHRYLAAPGMGRAQNHLDSIQEALCSGMATNVMHHFDHDKNISPLHIYENLSGNFTFSDDLKNNASSDIVPSQIMFDQNGNMQSEGHYQEERDDCHVFSGFPLENDPFEWENPNFDISPTDGKAQHASASTRHRSSTDKENMALRYYSRDNSGISVEERAMLEDFNCSIFSVGNTFPWGYDLSAPIDAVVLETLFQEDE